MQPNKMGCSRLWLEPCCPELKPAVSRVLKSDARAPPRLLRVQFYAGSLEGFSEFVGKFRKALRLRRPLPRVIFSTSPLIELAISRPLALLSVELLVRPHYRPG